MSTIKVDNIRIASESVSRPVTGVAAAFCNIYNDSTSGSTLNSGSLNTSSYTDSGTGVGQIKFTIPFSQPSYKIGVSGQVNASGAGSTMRGTSSGSTASVYDVRTYDITGAPAAISYMSMIFHGDLA